MKLTDEAKRDLLNFVIEKVADIANKEYQKRVWIRGEGPEVDDFDETACHFLHEGGKIDTGIIAEAMEVIKTKDVDAWVKQWIGTTLTSKRRWAFGSWRKKRKHNPERESAGISESFASGF